MALPTVDPIDGLPVMAVGNWAPEKHEYLSAYINAARQARRRFPQCEYIDLYCGPGRVVTKDDGNIRDGGVLTAWKISKEEGIPFSAVQISDSDANAVDACSRRLRALGATVVQRVGAAADMAIQAAASANEYGLHVVFLDPYNASALPFRVFEPFFQLKHVDFIVHYSENDIQRNLEQAITDQESHLDAFAPGWRNAVDRSAKQTMRVHFMNHWLSLFTKRGFKYAESMPLIVNSKEAPLYKLVLISRADLALKLWNAVTNRAKQKKLF